MKLTPLDIKKQEFTRTLRGYDTEEVQAFLNMMASQWESMLDENRQMEQKVRDAESKLVHYQQVEMALQQALQTAKQSSKQALDHAQRQAKMILQEAETKASAIKQNALKERDSLSYQAEKLKVRRDEVVAQLRAFLMSEVEFLSRFEGTEMRSHRLLQSQVKDDSDDEEPAPEAMETAEFEVEEHEERQEPIHELEIDAAMGAEVAFEAMDALMEADEPEAYEEDEPVAEEEEIGWYFGEEDADDFTDPLLDHIAQAGETEREEQAAEDALSREALSTDVADEDLPISMEADALMDQSVFDEPTFNDEDAFEHTITFEEPDAFADSLEDLTEAVGEADAPEDIEAAEETMDFDALIQAGTAISEAQLEEDEEEVLAFEEQAEAADEEVFAGFTDEEETATDEPVMEEMPTHILFGEEETGEEEAHDEALSFDFFETADEDTDDLEAFFVDGGKVPVDHETQSFPGDELTEAEDAYEETFEVADALAFTEEEAEEDVYLEAAEDNEAAGDVDDFVIEEEYDAADEEAPAVSFDEEAEEEDAESEKAGALAGWLVESALSASKEKTADLPGEAEGDGAQPPKKPKAPSAHQAASDEIEKIRRILNDLE